jgi:type IV pilus assembly protein PilC
MPVFLYQVKDKNGRAVSGQLDALTMRDAAAKLRDDGYFITSIRPKGVGGARKKSIFAGFGGKVSLKDLLLFSKQLAVLIRAGLNINTCLRILNEQTENRNFAMVIGQIRAEVEGGEALFVTFKRRPKIFPAMYIHMVEAGEASGQLETVLERLAEHLEREFELKKKVKGAMIYPAVIATVAVAAVFVLMIFVVPTFTQMFTDSGMELPGMTQLLVKTSGVFTKYWYVLLVVLAGIIFGFKYYYNTPAGRNNVDKLLFGMMVVGPVIKKLVAARFTRTLATLLDSGVLITNAMEIVERAVGNAVVSSAINKARVSVTKGSGIASPLAETKTLPLMVTQMISVGEETGELSIMLNNVADFYEKEAAHAIEGLTSLIEPAIIVFMGLVVGAVVTAIYLPMMDISSGATM